MNSLNILSAARLAVAFAALACGAAWAAPPSSTTIADLDLSQAFHTAAPWRLIAVQGAPVDDVVGMGDQVPGAVELCLRAGPSGPCDPQLRAAIPVAIGGELYATPHLLIRADIVWPRGRSGPPLLLVQTGSIQSVDGGRLILTQALRYRRDRPGFQRIYDHVTGSNNNQEVRFIAAGPLRGDIISVEPTQTAPFGFWVTVNALTPAYDYKPVLRYRSATRYGDGNPLAVIDSEMAAIERRLGLWRPGAPLPRPAGACPRPHLVREELWCG